MVSLTRWTANHCSRLRVRAEQALGSLLREALRLVECVHTFLNSCLSSTLDSISHILHDPLLCLEIARLINDERILVLGPGVLLVEELPPRLVEHVGRTVLVEVPRTQAVDRVCIEPIAA